MSDNTFFKDIYKQNNNKKRHHHYGQTVTRGENDDLEENLSREKKKKEKRLTGIIISYLNTVIHIDYEKPAGGVPTSISK